MNGQLALRNGDPYAVFQDSNPGMQTSRIRVQIFRILRFKIALNVVYVQFNHPVNYCVSIVTFE